MTIARDEVRSIGEFFEETTPGPRAIAMWGPPGIGFGAAVGDLARVARIHGFVPIDAGARRRRSSAGSIVTAGCAGGLVGAQARSTAMVTDPRVVASQPEASCRALRGAPRGAGRRRGGAKEGLGRCSRGIRVASSGRWHVEDADRAGCGTRARAAGKICGAVVGGVNIARDRAPPSVVPRCSWSPSTWRVGRAAARVLPAPADPNLPPFGSGWRRRSQRSRAAGGRRPIAICARRLAGWRGATIGRRRPPAR